MTAGLDAQTRLENIVALAQRALDANQITQTQYNAIAAEAGVTGANTRQLTITASVELPRGTELPGAHQLVGPIQEALQSAARQISGRISNVSVNTTG